MSSKSQKSSDKYRSTSNLFRGRSTGPTIPLPQPLDGPSNNDDSPALVPDPSTLELPPRPPPAGELPPPVEFLTPSKFQGEFVTDANRISNFPPDIIAEDALSTRVILHPRMPELLDKFLKYKRVYGSSYERALYPNMTWPQLATRLITNRPLCFLQRNDFTRLRDNTWIGAAWQEWDRVGTEAQHLNQHLTLAEYLSYDEIMLSSLVGVSCPTHFINTGSRYNSAVPNTNPTTPHEPRGILIGLAGPRFDRDAQHDSALILRPDPRNDQGARMDPAVRRLIRAWLAPDRDDKLVPATALYDADTGFDVEMYKARCRIAFDVLLLEASTRAADAGLTAHVHLVGLGLGVWRRHRVQNTWYVEALADSLHSLPAHHRVAGLEIGWIADDVAPGARSAVEAAGRARGIEVVFTKKDPCRKVEAAGRLLVVSWAWDGNSYVGNEYWNGCTDSSGDPAAVCCSTVGELANPDVNPFAGRVWVVGRGEWWGSEEEDESEEDVVMGEESE